MQKCGRLSGIYCKFSHKSLKGHFTDFTHEDQFTCATQHSENVQYNALCLTGKVSKVCDFPFLTERLKTGFVGLEDININSAGRSAKIDTV